MKARTWLILAILAIAAISIFFVNSNQQHLDFIRTLRNNWSLYIYADKPSPDVDGPGGFDTFDVSVRNNTDYFIDELVVNVKYVKSSGGIYKTEPVTITNIPPNSIKSGRAPGSPRGTSVDVKVTQVISRGLNLCYPLNNGDIFDPYYCK